MDWCRHPGRKHWKNVHTGWLGQVHQSNNQIATQVLYHRLSEHCTEDLERAQWCSWPKEVGASKHAIVWWLFKSVEIANSFAKHFRCMPSPSLVPRLFVGRGKEEPGIHRSRIHLINCLWTMCIGVGVDKWRVTVQQHKPTMVIALTNLCQRLCLGPPWEKWAVKLRCLCCCPYQACQRKYLSGSMCSGDF